MFEMIMPFCMGFCSFKMFFLLFLSFAHVTVEV